MSKLQTQDPEFIAKLSIELSNNAGSANAVSVDSHLLPGWALQYNLHNPENFEDAATAGDWYSPEDIFEYYENPFVNPKELLVSSWSEDDSFVIANNEDLSALQTLIKNHLQFDESILKFFINYTFSGGGAYASKEHFEYAMHDIGKVQGVNFAHEMFIKKLVQLNEIYLVPDTETLLLRFSVAWDEEHGLHVLWKIDGTLSVIEM